MSEDKVEYVVDKQGEGGMVAGDGLPRIDPLGTAETSFQRLPSSFLRDVNWNENMTQPSYYAVITAEVRYDNRLSSSQKLLYAEITALSQKTGKCWASNKYFSDLYGVSKETISRWVSSLVRCGYVQSQIFRKEHSQEVDMRVLTINATPSPQKTQDPLDEKRKDNTTSVNTTSLIESEDLKDSDSQPSIPPKKVVPPDFSAAWEAYGKKGNKQTALRYWHKLSSDDKLAIKAKIPAYIASKPEVVFRKDFQGWINPTNRHWEDEIVAKSAEQPRGMGNY